MLRTVVMVETRNVFGLFSCESFLLYGVEIFVFAVLCCTIPSNNYYRPTTTRECVMF